MKTSTIITAAALSATLVCASVSCSGAEHSYKIPVMVNCGEGYTVVGGNTARVSPGEDASFRVELEDGCEIVQLIGEGASYSDGVITVSGVRFPETIRPVAVKNPVESRFFVESDGNGGRVTSSVEQGRLKSGTVITVTAAPGDSAEFIGWSFFKKASEGAKIVSEQKSYTFTLGDSYTFVYANFKRTAAEPKLTTSVPERYREIVVYSPNGGTVADGSATYTDIRSTEFYRMGNTVADPDTFARDGYVLIGYNTAADGSGEAYGIGHKFPYSGNGSTLLYCDWRKASDAEDFVFTESGGGLTLSAYNGTDDVVCIPEAVGGRKVTAIAGGAFSGCKFDTLIIPHTVTTVQKNAVMDCNFNDLYLFDSVVSISDASFSGTVFHTLHLNAAIKPRYPDNRGSFANKYERLLITGDKPRIVLLSGSSKLYGINTPELSAMLGDKYSIVNFGTHAQMNITLHMDMIEDVLNEGDTLLFAPEQIGPASLGCFGSRVIPAISYQGCESCYNLFLYIDFADYTKAFDSLAEYNAIRRNMKEKEYSIYSSGVNNDGDITLDRSKLKSDSYRNGGNGYFRLTADVYPQANVDFVNEIFDRIADKGCTPLVSFPPYNRNNFYPEELTDTNYEVYMQFYRDKLHARLISDVRNYIMEPKYMYDTDYHLNDAGVKLHDEQVASDLISAGY